MIGVRGLICLLLLLPLPAFAGLFIDDFEDGDDFGWRVVRGEWKVEGGAYVSANPIPNAARNLSQVSYTMLQSPWRIKDGAVELSIRFDERAEGGDEALLLYRMEDDENGYALKIWKEGLTIYKIVVGNLITIRMEPSVVKPTVNHVKLELEGMWMKVHLNGVLRMRIGDPEKSRYEEGRIGLGVPKAKFPVRFEEVRVEGEGIYQFRVNMPVEAKGKLPLLWGEIKGR